MRNNNVSISHPKKMSETYQNLLSTHQRTGAFPPFPRKNYIHIKELSKPIRSEFLNRDQNKTDVRLLEQSESLISCGDREA